MAQRRLTWPELEERCDDLAAHLRSLHPHIATLNGVYGIPRGGITPAVMIAQRLGLPMLDAPDPLALVVDDLVDSGSTLQGYLDTHSAAAVAVLYHKAWSPAQFRFGAEDVGDAWLIFPWETDEVPALDAALRLFQAAGMVTTTTEAKAAAAALVDMVIKSAEAARTTW